MREILFRGKRKDKLRSIDNMIAAPPITSNTKENFEVIGNIFDNPELLGGEAK